MRRDLKAFHRLLVDNRRPSMPLGTRVYAIGDIHGRLDLLDRLLKKIDMDLLHRPSVRPIWIFLGDYIDRGPSSRETIDRLIDHGKNHESVFLKGNHEAIALKCLSDPSLFGRWITDLGGRETLNSYDVAVDGLSSHPQIAQLQAALHGALPRTHLQFFRDLQTSFSCGDFFFAHAGVKPNVDLSSQVERDLLWIRDEFLQSDQEFGKIIVHGHTPAAAIEVRKNRINIDTGAFATGRLTSLVIEDQSLSAIDTSSGV